MSMCYWCNNQSYCRASNRDVFKEIEAGRMYCRGFKASFNVISMGRTSPPFVNEQKSVTRRDWSKVTARKFQHGQIFIAYSKQVMYGGEPLGIGQLTADPFKQQLNMMVGRDYAREGFEYLDQQAGTEELWEAFVRWGSSTYEMTVVPFKILEVFPGMQEMYSTEEEIRKAINALVEAIG